MMKLLKGSTNEAPDGTLKIPYRTFIFKSDAHLKRKVLYWHPWFHEEPLTSAEHFRFFIIKKRFFRI